MKVGVPGNQAVRTPARSIGLFFPVRFHTKLIAVRMPYDRTWENRLET